MVLPEESTVNAGFFLGGVGIDLAAHILHPAEDMIGGTFLRAFEKHMFQQVRNPVLFGHLISRSGVDHEPAMGNRTFHMKMDQADAIR